MSFGKSINHALGNAARQSVIAQQKRVFKAKQKDVKEAIDAKKSESTTEELMIDVLRKHDRRYEAGSETIPDEAYDNLKEDIRAKFPSNPYFKTNTTPNPEAVKEPALPVAMPGLTKVRPDSALAWVTSLGSKVDIVQDAEKIDGIACMLKYRDGVLVSAQKKGDEGYGKDIMPFVKYVASVPKKLTWKYIEKLSMPITMRGDLVIRGELACSFETWEPYAKSGKNPHGFAHPRVMAAGIFRRDTVDAVTVKQLKAVDFIACTVAWPAQATPARSRLILQNLFPIVAYGKQLSFAEMTPDELVNLIKDAKDYSPYPCDGIVLSASDGGEIHQVAVKLNTADQTAVKTVVERVEYNMSSRNLLKPTIIIKPIVIDGIEINRVTGNNARQINKYKIGPGSIVWVVRSGDVIPHIIGMK